MESSQWIGVRSGIEWYLNYLKEREPYSGIEQELLEDVLEILPEEMPE